MSPPEIARLRWELDVAHQRIDGAIEAARETRLLNSEIASRESVT